ncbi:MAG: hypothetical protein RBS78_08400 [Coriobacteriia bacterium]|jgi:MoaA/NifB/PqqE/SkfB family radical SAM enzyme|nr:hypothetical protein [Coriobacteriia bacterium]
MLEYREISLGGIDEAICIRCTPRVQEEPTLSTAAENLDGLVAEGAPAGVLFTNADSTELDVLAALVRRAVRSDITRIGIRTSGRILRQEQDAMSLVSAGVRVAEVAFAGPDSSEHDALIGVPGSFDVAAGAIRAFSTAAKGLGVRAAIRSRIPVCAHNLHLIPATVMACAEMGVSSMLLVCEPSLDPRRSVEWISAACDTGTVNRVWVAVSGVSAEALGGLALHAQDVMALTEVS